MPRLTWEASVPWTLDDIPDLDGRVALVTGANSGIGYWTALHLARRGAHVVMACRSAERAAAALGSLRAAVPDAAAEVLPLDLADLASVRRAAQEQREKHARLDVLVNNAGVALVPRGRTADDFEMHLGANFLGHFALTGLLLPTIAETPAARVVHVGSLQHRLGRIDVTDPHYERRRFVRANAYGQSKLAALTFMVELDRRFRSNGVRASSVGAHPGVSGTGIADDYKIRNIAALRPTVDWILEHWIPTPEDAARPSLRAATDISVPGGSYLGPSGPFEMGGAPEHARLARRATDHALGRAVVTMAEQLTGTPLPL